MSAVVHHDIKPTFAEPYRRKTGSVPTYKTAQRPSWKEGEEREGGGEGEEGRASSGHRRPYELLPSLIRAEEGKEKEGEVLTECLKAVRGLQIDSNAATTSPTASKDAPRGLRAAEASCRLQSKLLKKKWNRGEPLFRIGPPASTALRWPSAPLFPSISSPTSLSLSSSLSSPSPLLCFIGSTQHEPIQTHTEPYHRSTRSSVSIRWSLHQTVKDIINL